MLKKRLVGVVTVKDGWAVQSMGYKRYLPLGRPECVIENLDRWGADEILVQVIDRSVNGWSPDFDLLERVARLGLQTPLIYGGGIHTVEDGVRVIQAGADRVVVDAVLHGNIAAVFGLSELLGAQAIIAALPLSWREDRLEWLDYCSGNSNPISAEVLELAQAGTVSELLLIDWRHEGRLGSFEQRLARDFPLSGVPLIVFGGISNSSQMAELLLLQNVVAIAVGNFLSYREHAIQKFKENLAAMPLRSSTYESKYSSVANVC